MNPNMLRKYNNGGPVNETGPALLHQGEFVLPAGAAPQQLDIASLLRGEPAPQPGGGFDIMQLLQQLQPQAQPGAPPMGGMPVAPSRNRQF